MKTFVGIAIAATLLTSAVAEAHDGRRWHRNRTVIVEQPAVGLGVGIAGLLLLNQLMAQPQMAQREQLYEQPRELEREPKLRQRDNPIPLK